jgi:hypothetical protein
VPAYNYTGTEALYYPSIGRDVRPGDCIQWDVAPEDGRWVSADAPSPVPAKAKAASAKSAPAAAVTKGA